MSMAMTAAEVADELRISKKLVYKLAAKGELPARKFGSRVVFPRKAIEALLMEGAQGEEAEKEEQAS